MGKILTKRIHKTCPQPNTSHGKINRLYGKMPERIYTAKHKHTTDISSRSSQSTHIKVTNCSTTGNTKSNSQIS